jgi:predicted aspartyl protease
VGNIVMNNVRAAVLEGGPAQLSHVLIGMSFLHGIEMRNAGRRMELIQKQF